jgi:hypothetical protein
VELEAEVDRLYGVPLDEFVRERDELAKRLRREGERESAERIKALRKPSAGAWALNQAVRRRRKETDALLAAGERLREAHEALLSGGDPAALRDAMHEERELAGALADCAEAIASETGKSGPALRERVRSTLHAASVDDEARDELEKGRFVREREAVGLGPFGAGAAPPVRSRPKRDRAGTARDADTGRERGRGGGATSGRSGGGRTADTGRGRSGGGRTADTGRGRSRGRAKAGAARDRSAEDAAREREEAAERERQAELAEAEEAVHELRASLEEAEEEHSEAAARLQAAREAVGAAEDAEREARAVARERRRELGKRERELERLRAKRA